MKKVILVVTVLLLLVMFVGCSQNNEHLEQQRDQLMSEITDLSEQKAAIEADITNIKEENGVAKYIITFRIKQSHFTLDISEHIKDSMNEITFDVPVDKEYYDSVSVGSVINDDFRMGSLVMHGSFGSWNVTVDKKEIR